MTKIFVYGTLRKGGKNFKGASLGEDRIVGKLYRLSWFPGVRDVRALFNEEGPYIIGEVYEISEETFEQLDDYEGCSQDPTLENSGFYYRKQVQTENGEIAWVYIHSQEIPENLRIYSGDWLEQGEKKCV